VRLFLAIEPDEPARRALESALADLARQCGPLAPALRWTPGPNLHCTLHFLGDVDAAGLVRLDAALSPPLDVAPVVVKAGRVALHPLHGRPRMIWMDIQDERGALGRLHAVLAARLAAAQFAVDEGLTPHLTLARVRDRERDRTRDLRAVARTLHAPSIAWRAAEATLFESQLSSSAPRYRALRRLPLVGADAAPAATH
jgi:2'-5' RNA ligase